MARRYKRPRCVAFLDNGHECGHEMEVLGERHPYAAHYRQDKVHVFHCGYCNAVQAMDDSKLEKYLEHA